MFYVKHNLHFYYFVSRGGCFEDILNLMKIGLTDVVLKMQHSFVQASGSKKAKKKLLSYKNWTCLQIYVLKLFNAHICLSLNNSLSWCYAGIQQCIFPDCLLCVNIFRVNTCFIVTEEENASVKISVLKELTLILHVRRC